MTLHCRTWMSTNLYDWYVT